GVVHAAVMTRFTRNANVKLLFKSVALVVFLLSLIEILVVSSHAESPGEFRPQPCLVPAEQVGSTGVKTQPPDTLPQSRSSAADPTRKPKLSRRAPPALKDNELVFNAGWELVEAGKVKIGGSTLSQTGVDTREWYDATVPGTVLGTLVEQGVYP